MRGGGLTVHMYMTVPARPLDLDSEPKGVDGVADVGQWTKLYLYERVTGYWPLHFS